jgi:hypothetical protein
VANATKTRIAAGVYLTTELSVVPMSGVMLAEIQPTAVAFASPYLTRSVAVNEVNAYEEEKLLENPKDGKT